MKFEKTPLEGVLVLRPRVFADERGSFLESWNSQTFAAAGHDWDFVQDNHSRSFRGALRGLHFQLERPQGKLVRVAHGRVFDVVVDLRRSSPSFGRWMGLELSGSAHTMVWAPPGCAHGFYVLSEYADFLYKTTEYYHPESQFSLRWDDPRLGIQWPLPEGKAEREEPLLSENDRAGLGWDEIPFFD